MAESRDYLLCGWRVRSEIALPDEIAWRGDDRPIDVVIRIGEVPAALPDAVQATPFLQIARDGACRLEIAAAGRYLVGGSREVVVQPAAGATPAELRLFLLGTVLGMLCHQRGLFPLHASCVRIGNGAVAFCGASGAGKSTLAAALTRRGHALLADDVSVIDTAPASGPIVWPALPRMRLWRDSLDALEVDAEALERDRIQIEKFVLPSAAIGRFESEPVPVKAIFLLESIKVPDLVGVHGIPPMESVKHLTDQVYRHRQALAMGRRAALFADAGRIVAATPVRRLARLWDLAQLDEVVATVENLVGP